MVSEGEEVPETWCRLHRGLRKAVVVLAAPGATDQPQRRVEGGGAVVVHVETEVQQVAELAAVLGHAGHHDGVDHVAQRVLLAARAQEGRRVAHGEQTGADDGRDRRAVHQVEDAPGAETALHPKVPRIGDHPVALGAGEAPLRAGDHHRWVTQCVPDVEHGVGVVLVRGGNRVVATQGTDVLVGQGHRRRIGG